MCDKCCRDYDQHIDYICPKCNTFIELCYGEGTYQCAGFYGIDIYCINCNWSMRKNNSKDYIDNNMCIIDSKLIEIDNIIKNISKNGKELNLINDIKKLINFKIKLK